MKPEAVEHFAALLAVACNGGTWETHYTESRKTYGALAPFRS